MRPGDALVLGVARCVVLVSERPGRCALLVDGRQLVTLKAGSATQEIGGVQVWCEDAGRDGRRVVLRLSAPQDVEIIHGKGGHMADAMKVHVERRDGGQTAEPLHLPLHLGRPQVGDLVVATFGEESEVVEVVAVKWSQRKLILVVAPQRHELARERPPMVTR